MKLRDVGYELFCLLLPRSSSAAKVTLQMEACRCSGCEGCWRFTGEHDHDGHGLVTGPLGTRRTRAEVALWTHLHGPLAEGLELVHLARYRPGHPDCCNTSHLEPRQGSHPST